MTKKKRAKRKSSRPAPKNFNAVLQKIREIIKLSSEGDYIYRGEPKCHEKVTSNLYRLYEDEINAENFDIKIVQQEILQEAKDYTDITDDFIIQTELQHYGGKTNLIDFTTDYLIALFFACDGFHDEDGKLILVRKDNETIKEKIKLPKTPKHRVIAQKSVFIEPDKGFIEPDNEIKIPKKLKLPILDYLRKHHDISTATIYNDLHGFIIKQGIHQSAYTELFKGITAQNVKDYGEAIKHYTQAIELNPTYAIAYNNRGAAYDSKGEYNRAIQDFDKAIELNPTDAAAYNNRGIAYAKKGKHDHAIQDFDKAIERNSNYAAAYNNRGAAYSNKEEYDRAIQDFDKAIEFNPTDADAYSNRGNTDVRKGEYDRAIQDLDKAIEFNPDDANAYYNRGLAYRKKGKNDHAIKDFDKAIRCGQKFPPAYYNRGIIHLIQETWPKAKADLIIARDKGLDIVDVFQKEYQDIPTFEKRYNVKLPKDIVALLTPNSDDQHQ